MRCSKIREWNRKLDYRLIKELWTFRENRIAVRDDGSSSVRSAFLPTCVLAAIEGTALSRQGIGRSREHVH
jgi:hypothetical protein